MLKSLKARTDRIDPGIIVVEAAPMEPATPEGAEITVNLGDQELVHALYVAAADLDTSADEVVAEAVRMWLANRPREGAIDTRRSQ